MSFTSVLGDIARGAGSILSATLPTAIPAGLNYLAAREQSRAARDVSKVRSGASGGMAVQQRLRQSGGNQMRFTGRSSGGGDTLSRLGIQTTPPYQQADVGAAEILLEGLGAGAAWLFSGNGNGNGRVCGRSGGGTVIAQDLEDFYTDCGNPRGTVASVANGRMTYWSNRGQPVIFSRDAATCRRIKKLAGKSYRAAGGSSSSRKR